MILLRRVYLRKMSNKIIYIILLIIASVKLQAQVTDTIFVYDSVKVYDTIKVMDSNSLNFERVKENFEKNKSLQKAVLVVDTTNQNAQLVLFNKKDTATLFINRILLSENLNNSDTMKKNILTLAALAMLTQASSAQSTEESKSAKAKETTPSFNVGAGTFLAINTQADRNIQGGNIKANKVKNVKTLYGLSADIARIYKNGWNSGSDKGNAVYQKSKGLYLNFFANATYYFLGNVNSNLGMYGKFGLGIVRYKTTQTMFFVGIPGEHNYILGSFNFSAQLCIGSEIKLGKGKLFAEVVSLPSIYEMRSITLPESTEAGNGTLTRNNISNNNYAQQLGFRVG